MNATEKQYVEKLKELVEHLKNMLCFADYPAMQPNSLSQKL